MSDGGMTDAELFAGVPASDPAQAQPGLTGSDADLITRAAIAEGDPSDPKSWQTIAGVIKNRMAKSGRSAAEVLSEPGQFEAFGNGSLQKVDPKSDAYVRAGRAVQPVLTGQVQVPYDSFYSPAVIQGRKGAKPGWDDGTGAQVGSQLFFKDKYAGSDITPEEQAEWQRLTGNPAPQGADPDVTNAATGERLTPVQQLTARALQASGDMVSGSGAPTYKGSPIYVSQGAEQPQRQGDYWIDPRGQLHQVPVDYNGAVSFANGGMLGFGNKFMAGVEALKASGGNPTNPMFGNFYDQALSHFTEAQDAYTREHPVQSGLTTTGGNIATVVPALAAGGEFLAPARAALGPVGDFLAGASKGNKFLQVASRGTNGAIQGAASSAMTAGQSDKPLAQQVVSGAVGGGFIGAAAPEVLGAGKAVINKFTGSTPAVSPEVADLAKTAVDKYGIPLRVSQIKGVEDRGMAFADSERIGADKGYAANNAEQKTAFTQAVAKTFGSDADRLTPDVMQAAKSRIGGVMNGIAARTTIGDTDALLTKLGGIVHDAQQVLPDAEAAPLLKQVENIGSTIEDGKISGETYQKLTAKGSPLDKAAESSNPNIRHYAQSIRDALDDALEASAAPEDAKALQQARFQYKNLMTVKNLAAKANVQGEISPSLLNGAVNTSFKNRAFSGAGDLGELAQIGQAFMKEPPNSGTAARLANKFGAIIPGLVGGAGAEGVQMFMHDPAMATKIAAAGVGGMAIKAGAKYATRAYNLSDTVRDNMLRASLAPAAKASGGGALRYMATPAGIVVANRFLDQHSAQNAP